MTEKPNRKIRTIFLALQSSVFSLLLFQPFSYLAFSFQPFSLSSMPRFFFRWLGFVLLLGLTGCGLIDPVGTAIKKLKDPDASVRLTAIEKLRSRHDARAVEPLIASLKDDDMGVRTAAAAALGELDDVRAIEPLIACLPTDYTELRKATITALGKLDNARVGKRLIFQLQNKGTEPAMTLAVIETLGALRYPGTVDALLPCLGNESEQISNEATDALSQVGAPAVEQLITCLKDPKAQVRERAAEALGRIGDARAVEPLIACLKNPGPDQAAAGGQDTSNGDQSDDQKRAQADEESQVRQKAAEALGKLGKPAVEPLMACLDEKDPSVRSLAATALGQLHDSRAIAPLITHMLQLSGKDPADEENSAGVNVHDSLRDALAELGEPAIKPVMECMKDKNVHVQEDAAVILDKLHYLPSDTEGKAAFFVLLQSWDKLIELGTPAVPPLLGCLKDEDAGRRQGAAEALGELGDKRAVVPLIACLQDDSMDVKKNAAKALAQLGDKRAVAPLINVLKNDTTEVGLAAAEALGLLGDSAAVPALVASLTDQDAGLRQTCAQALDKLHYQPEKVEDNITYLIALQAWDKVAKLGAPAFEPLSACLSDQNMDIKQGAIGALGDLGDKRAIAPLHDALPDWNLNASLVPALEKLGWKPASDAEQIYDWIGKQDSSHLKQAWEKTSKVLLDDVSSGDQRKVQNAVYSFMALGEPKVLDDLVQILDDHGDKDMAETFLNCGNDKLEQAARDWASKNGFQTMMLPTGSSHQNWGSW
jgi:HEAT repeat protein